MPAVIHSEDAVTAPQQIANFQVSAPSFANNHLNPQKIETDQAQC